MIKNKASVNEESTGNMEMMKKEIKRLKEELTMCKKKLDEVESNMSGCRPN